MNTEPQKRALLLWWLLTFGTESSKAQQFAKPEYNALKRRWRYDSVDAKWEGFLESVGDSLDLRLTQKGLDYLNKD